MSVTDHNFVLQEVIRAGRRALYLIIPDFLSRQHPIRRERHDACVDEDFRKRLLWQCNGLLS